MGSLWLGFVIVAGLVLLIGLLLWAARDRILRIPFMNTLIEALFEKDNDEED